MTFTSIGVTTAGHVTTVEIQRPPNNFFDITLIEEIATVFEAADDDPAVRALVLAAQGKAFCAGADFSRRDVGDQRPGRHLYKEALRLFRTRKPVVAAVQGPAIGGGLGLACMADFRVTCAEARFSAAVRSAIRARRATCNSFISERISLTTGRAGGSISAPKRASMAASSGSVLAGRPIASPKRRA